MWSVIFRPQGHYRRVWPASLVLLCLAALSTSTYAGRAFFTFPLDGTASVWPQATVPTTLDVPSLQGVVIKDQDIFRQQGIDALDVKHLKIRQIGLLMQAPTLSPDFSFLHGISVYVSADGLPDVKVASGQSFVAGTNYIGLDVDDVELLPYARKPSMGFRGQVDAADAPGVDTTLRLVIDLEAYVAQPGAACWQR